MAPPVVASALLQIIIASSTSLPLVLSAATPPPPPMIGLDNCTTTCGDVQVPYPFGLGPPRCYLPGFDLTCDTSRPGHRPRLLLGGRADLRVVDIIHDTGIVTVVHTGGGVNITSRAVVGPVPLPAPYMLSGSNELVLIGCNVQATLIGFTIGNDSTEQIIGGCASSCSDLDSKSGWWEWKAEVDKPLDAKYCSGIGCCQAPISGVSKPQRALYWRFDLNTSVMPVRDPGVLAFVTQEGWFDNSTVATKILSGGRPTADLHHRASTAGLEVPIDLRWAVPVHDDDVTTTDQSDCSNKTASRLCRSTQSECYNVFGGSLCHCKPGYDGNAYIEDGCQDINECEVPEAYSCFGKCTNTIGGFDCRCPQGTRGNHTFPHGCRTQSHTGLIIGKGVGSGAGFVVLVLIAFLISQRLKQRSITKLKQKYFKQNRGQLLQQLVSQRADIAERMIIPVDELAKATNNFDKARELGGGGHGTVYKGILSDLHVVAIKKSKITVQTEIDEFINEVAILSQVNHRNVVKLFGCCLETEVPLLVYEFISNGTLYHHLHVEGMSWANRLRIATEIATALAFLHSSISIPIIHRDIKSSNILLDDTLTSKISDFGASRYIPVDRTGLTTRVQGTIGYLDPTYFYTGRLTYKSDVYSFGIILLELLTRKKPFLYLSPDGDGLVSHFVNLLAEENLSDILDPQVIEEGGKEVQQVAILAASCIKLSDEDRPTMRQVELTLEGLQVSKQYGKNNNMIADKFVDDSIGLSDPSTKAKPREQELSRRYSMEQEVFMSARYPR